MVDKKRDALMLKAPETLREQRDSRMKSNAKEPLSRIFALDVIVTNYGGSFLGAQTCEEENRIAASHETLK